MPHIPYIQSKSFSEAEYLQFQERILDKLESMGLKDLRKHIVYEDVWTPHDIENTYNSNKGAIYGVVSNKKKNKGFKFPKKSVLQKFVLCRWFCKSWRWYAYGYFEWYASSRSYY